MYKKEIKDNRNVEDKLNDITVVVASHRISEAVILFTKCWLMSESSKKYNLVIGYDKDWNVDDIKKIKQLYDKVYDVSDVYEKQKKFYKADREIGFAGKVGVIRKLVKTRYAIWLDDDIEIIGDITPFIIPYFNSNKWIGVPRYRSMNPTLYDSGFENGFYQKHNTQNGFYIVDITSQQFNEYADFMSCGKMFDDEIGLLKYYNGDVNTFNEDTFDLYDRNMFETTDAIKDSYHTWRHPERFAKSIQERNVIIKHWAGRPLKKYYINHMKSSYKFNNLKDIVVLYSKNGFSYKQMEYEILEIEYVIKSIKKFCTSFVDRIFVIGDDVPKSIENDVIVYHCDNPYTHCKDANLIHKIRFACTEIKDLSDDFLVVSDDQIVTKESNWDDFVPRLNKKLTFNKSLLSKGDWKVQLYHTLEQFNSKNIFEPHIWSPMNKNKFLEMCDRFDYQHNSNCIVFTLYYNFIKQKPINNFEHTYIPNNISNFKLQKLNINNITRHLSWTDNAFKNVQFRNLLNKIVGFDKENNSPTPQPVIPKNSKSKLRQIKEDIKNGKLKKVFIDDKYTWKRYE